MEISVIADVIAGKTTGPNLMPKPTIWNEKPALRETALNCALFGPVHVIASEPMIVNPTLVFFEAARGGDGDHSGPIIEIYRLTNHGFRKLGEQQLFRATYQRKK